MTALQHITSASLIAVVTLGSLADAQAGNPRFDETTSPDGSRVAFVSSDKGGYARIVVERSDGTRRLELTGNGYSDFAPNWSPDGKRIAFVSDRNGKMQIFVMDRDGTGVEQLSDDDTAKNDSSPNWSPDGKRIAFVSNRSGKWQIYAMDIDGAKVEQLTHDDTGAMRPKYAPDGRVGYLAQRGHALKSALYDLVILEGDRHSTLRAKSAITDFSWGHKGRMIAYGLNGEIVFHDFRNGSDRSVRLIDIDKRLDTHAGFEFCWMPKQNVLSCRLRFMGDVPEGLVLFGDNQFLTISPSGAARLLNRGEKRW